MAPESSGTVPLVDAMSFVVRTVGPEAARVVPGKMDDLEGRSGVMRERESNDGKKADLEARSGLADLEGLSVFNLDGVGIRDVGGVVSREVAESRLGEEEVDWSDMEVGGVSSGAGLGKAMTGPRRIESIDGID